MNTLLERPALYTDYYELTMAQGYFLSGRKDEWAGFDYFFRDEPFNGGYVIFAGLSDLLAVLGNMEFHQRELEYLESRGFDQRFLAYLEDLPFTPDIDSVKEGEVVFPREPLVSVEGSLIEVQLLETILLNTLNFESLIATKAARIRQSAGDRLVADFGLRRAQGLGGIQASKAAIIGGVDSTSNVYAAEAFELPATGTMAHSWIQSFDREIEAFRSYARYYPENCILLVDTYDTLEHGVPNAIKVAREMEKEGHRLKGIRLDSGDLAYYARKSREMLDKAGLDYVKIAASNQLDEYLVKSLIDQGAPIDLFGIGTSLVTGQQSPALDGVYKLNSVNREPRLKISENVEKISLPGLKQVERYFHPDGTFYGDGIKLAEEDSVDTIHHPHFPSKQSEVGNFESENLLQPVMKQGEQTIDFPSVQQSAEYARQRLRNLQKDHKRFENPHVYKVGISAKLQELRDDLLAQMKV